MPSRQATIDEIIDDMVREFLDGGTPESVAEAAMKPSNTILLGNGRIPALLERSGGRGGHITINLRQYQAAKQAAEEYSRGLSEEKVCARLNALGYRKNNGKRLDSDSVRRLVDGYHRLTALGEAWSREG